MPARDACTSSSCFPKHLWFSENSPQHRERAKSSVCLLLAALLLGPGACCFLAFRPRFSYWYCRGRLRQIGRQTGSLCAPEEPEVVVQAKSNLRPKEIEMGAPGCGEYLRPTLLGSHAVGRSLRLPSMQAVMH
jgi:hypothetical protein